MQLILFYDSLHFILFEIPGYKYLIKLLQMVYVV